MADLTYKTKARLETTVIVIQSITRVSSLSGPMLSESLVAALGAIKAQAGLRCCSRALIHLLHAEIVDEESQRLDLMEFIFNVDVEDLKSLTLIGKPLLLLFVQA